MWDTQYINDLPDSAFALIEKGGDKDDTGRTKPRSLRHFPYKDKEGNIDLPHLRNALARAPQSPLGKMAMAKLESAAKTMKIDQYAEAGKIVGDFKLTYAISEADFKPNDDKKEVTLTFMKEGWGNDVDRNYYSKPAVESLISLLKARKKMYLNHPKKEQNSRDIKEWSASILDVWTELNKQGIPITKGKIKVYDNWLWERMKDAPDEIAVSVRGRGEGSRKQIEGKEGNFIERISWVNSADFVDYPGNAPMGITFVENFKIGGNEEMDMKELTIAEIKESRPDLIEELKKELTPKPAVEPKKDDSAILEKFKIVEERLSKVEKEKEELVKKNDQLAIKEAIHDRKALIDLMIKESGLEQIAITPIFIRSLESAISGKDKDGKDISVEETIKGMIVEQKKLVADAREQKPISDPKGAGISVSEQEKIEFLREQGYTDEEIEKHGGVKIKK